MHGRVAASVSLLAMSCGGAMHPALVSRCGGDAVIASQADIRAIASCTSLRSLRIATAAPIELTALSSLQHIAGELAVGPTIALEALTLPALVDVGSVHIISNSSLLSVSLPQLTHAAAIVVEREPTLEMLSAPLLVHIDGDVRLDRVTSVATLDLNQLAFIGGTFAITGTTAFQVVVLAALQHVGSLAIDPHLLPAEAEARIAPWRSQPTAP